ncbi:MAG: hypothetical protein IH991_16215 [Planctomycetes bacterium]|nr:hypothetical protein [Planctomycetota bacterium]
MFNEGWIKSSTGASKIDLAKLGLRAMVGGMLACCMTACVAAILI